MYNNSDGKTSQMNRLNCVVINGLQQNGFSHEVGILRMHINNFSVVEKVKILFNLPAKFQSHYDAKAETVWNTIGYMI